MAGFGRENLNCGNCYYSEYDKHKDSLWCRKHRECVDDDELCDDWDGDRS